MNRVLKNFLQVMYPFYPLWAWLCLTITNKPIGFVLNLFLMPAALYVLMNSTKKVPKYLIFLIIFTVYHLYSVFSNDALPVNTTKSFFILNDFNLHACVLLIIVENINFDDKFIIKMSRNILWIVLISLIVSVIQIKQQYFFFNHSLADGLISLGEDRNTSFSIYSWVSLNSGGITLPILFAILISLYSAEKLLLYGIILGGVIISFLSKGRYFMVSIIVVISQLFFDRKKTYSKKLNIIFLFIIGIFFIVFIAQEFGYNIKETIDSRILEKNSDMASAKSRITSYNVFVEVFPENPLFGVGPKTRDNVIDLLQGEATIIHVGYLAYLYYYGIIGCFFIFLSIFYLLKEAWDVGEKYNFWGSFYGLLSFCLANLTFEYFYLNEMGIIVAVIYLKYFKDSSLNLHNRNL